MLTLTRQAAKEYAEFGVRVNAVAPGAVWHERLDALSTIGGVRQR